MIFWLCIAGAFLKFAIFENRIFLKREPATICTFLAWVRKSATIGTV